MQETGVRNGAYGADKFGLKDLKAVHWNLTAAPLYEHAIRNGEATVVAGGALCAETGHHTGRSPKDKHTVVDATTENTVWWDGNRKQSKEHFDNLYQDFLAHAKGKTLYAQDLYGGADKKYRIKARVFTELAWHSLFIRQLLIRPEHAELSSYVPDMTIVDMPSFKPDAKRHGGREGSDTMVAIDFTRKIVLICGSSYAGEMKKSVFTTLNFYLPAQGVMPMHCSANVGKNGDSALFFGLSGTGKTTLSADPNRTLIGDDETGWSPQGIFNFEGGCYAKTHQALGRSRTADLGRDQPLRRRSGKCRVRSRHPRPGLRQRQEDREHPLRLSARLHPERVAHRHRRASEEHHLPDRRRVRRDAADRQAHAGAGDVSLPLRLHRQGRGHREGLVGVEPEFSTCFGAPFLPRPPAEYGRLLRDYIAKHNVDCWLVNSGWTGGIYGVGRRMPIKVTRALVTGALDGSLRNASYRTDPYFGFAVPTSVPGIEPHILYPQKTWKDKAAFDETARKLVGMFQKNFTKYEQTVDAEVRAAAPEVRLAAE